MKIRKLKRKLLILLIIAALFSVYAYFENNTLEVTRCEVINEKLPEEFKGFKIAHISDLHNKDFGKEQNKLLELIKKEAPDIIVITGDLIDSRKTNVDISVEFIAGAVKIAPVYYAPGNHEKRIPDEYNELKSKIQSLGVTVLQNSSTQIVKGNSVVNIYGYDPSEIEDFDVSGVFDPDTSEYNMLLAHFPEDIDGFAKSGFDVMFSGHAHGGQFILPFIGAIFTPGEGFFPKYTQGVHVVDNTTLVISRGLGNSRIPIRINNNPELVICTLG